MSQHWSLIRMAMLILLAVAWSSSVAGPASADSNLGDSCVRDFFTVARVEYGWSPVDVVEMINTDGDPNFQVANVGELIDAVANAELGIFDTSGVFHICAT